MSCNWCHESTPPNRKDGFCSDICQIQSQKSEIERLTARRNSLAASLAKCRVENGRLTEGLEQIADWAQAYPLKTFPEPDFAKVQALLKAGGITLDAVSASNMRFVVTEVAEIARRALEPEG